MYLTRLSLTNFRALTRLDLDIPRRLVLLVGKNAQGKSSILEAIYYLATFSSFHAANDRQLINLGMSNDPLAVARIVAEFQTNLRKHTFEVRLIQEIDGGGVQPRFRKEILLNGVKKKVGDAIGQFNAVLFTPQMTKVIEGAPSDRRQYLDELISQVIPHYAHHLGEYAKVLTRRNALLKMLSENGGDATQLDVWDEMLAKHGAFVMQARFQAISEMAELAKRIHQRLTDGQEVLRLSYQPAYEPVQAPGGQLALPVDTEIDHSGFSIQELQAGFLAGLHASHKGDIQRGMTTQGPHRDELRFISNKLDLGEYGSRGQGRSAILSMKMAEVQWMKGKTGEWPVLLLDEILAELDPQRRSDLLKVVAEAEQGLLTSADLQMFEPDFVSRQQVWQVDGGMILMKS
jgi:DNA replication and repair protein RecF